MPILCYIIGMIVGFLICKSRSHGTIRIDNSIADEPPYLFLELTCSVDELKKHRTVVMNIKNENYITHE